MNLTRLFFFFFNENELAAKLSMSSRHACFFRAQVRLLVSILVIISAWKRLGEVESVSEGAAVWFDSETVFSLGFMSR